MEAQNELPWITNPFRLWSLEDMRRVFADLYLAIGQAIANTEVAFAAHVMDSGRLESLRGLLVSLKRHCEEVGLNVSPSLLGDAVINLPQSDREFKIYVSAVMTEIGTQLFLHVPYERAKYYNQDVHFFKNKIQNKIELIKAFPQATEELNSAGNCYALGESTACVFHSMRAAEIGLRAFALYPFLAITFDKPIEQAGWATIIRKLEEAIKEKVEKQEKTPERDKELRFCSEAAAQFRYFNLGWRVFSAHARQTYDEEAALKIMEAVTAFLESLVPKISEPDAI